MIEIGGGKREMVDVDRVRELIEPYQKVEEGVEKVSLRNKSYSEAAAQTLGEYLKTLTGLRIADLADMIAGRPEDEALKVLSFICDSLEGNVWKEIDLSDNALGEKGIRACMGVLRAQEDLERIYFCNNGISAAAAAVIADEVLLFRGEEAPTKLTLLHFYNNMSGDGGAQALARILPLSPNLTDLRFSATRAGRPGCCAFAKGMDSLHQLVRVDLSDNTFGIEGAEALVPALKNLSQLQMLNLRDTSIGDEGVEAICAAITSTSLTSLDLSGNDITKAAMPSIVKCVAKLPQLKELMLEENEIGSCGAKLLAKVLPSLKQLDTLVLNVNEIGASGAVAIVETISKDSTLKRLELDGNQFSEDGVMKIEQVLLDIEKNDILGSLEDNDDEIEEEEDEEDDDLIAQFEKVQLEN